MEIESDLIPELERRLDELLHSELPISRVKKICKLDPQTNLMNSDAVRMVTKSTEIFIKELSKACYTQAVIDKRRTVQKKDIDRVIKNNWMFEFLEDALDGWPEPGIRIKETNIDDSHQDFEDTLELAETLPLEELPEEMEETADSIVEETTIETEDMVQETLAEEAVQDTIEDTPDIFA